MTAIQWGGVGYGVDRAGCGGAVWKEEITAYSIARIENHNKDMAGKIKKLEVWLMHVSSGTES